MCDLIPPEPGSTCPSGSELPCRHPVDACTYPNRFDIPFPRSDTPRTDDREGDR